MKIPQKLIDFFYEMTKIKKPDMYESAARKLDVEVAAIKAVAEVESRGSGFLSTGEPVILFERHVFHQRTGGMYSAKNPDISNRSPGGYGKYSEQHKRLAKAAALDRNAALESASWGAFQIMGYHWKVLGYKTLQAFINAMYKDDEAHLDSFVRFIQVTRLDVFLRRHDWTEFARRYNGPAYAKNQYDKKIRDAYLKYKSNEK